MAAAEAVLSMQVNTTTLPTNNICIDSPCCGVPDSTLGNGELLPHTLFILASSSCLLSSLAMRSACSACTCWTRATSDCSRQWSLLVPYGLKAWLCGSIGAGPAFEVDASLYPLAAVGLSLLSRLAMGSNVHNRPALWSPSSLPTSLDLPAPAVYIRITTPLLLP